MPEYPASYLELCTLARQTATIGSVGALLGWDQETYMPRGAASHRAEQAAMIATLVHKRRIDPRMGELIAACEQDRSLTAEPGSAPAAAVREFRRDYDLASKLPEELVADLARVGSQAQEVWKQARAKNDFAMFAPWLQRMMDLTRRKAECYGIPRGTGGPVELYDALLDEYEPGMTAAEVSHIFVPLRERLAALLGSLAGSRRKPDDVPLRVKIDPERQHRFGLFLLESMGFDLHAGRLDVTTHPFCSGMAPGDTRLTTRYREEHFSDALYGTLHEMGHGLYEQGLPKRELLNGEVGTGGAGVSPAAAPPQMLFGNPLADSISLGIHESQSRMWENLVGRSRSFWEWALPHARRIMGSALEPFSADDLYEAVNLAQPSLIRVESDESTYNLHIMVRFEIERGLIAGDIAVRDVPGVWNERFRQYLGIDVPDDQRGCLQDVHWSFGLIGYFPTYTLGNLYASQFWETIRAQIPDLDGQIGRGEFSALKEWLNTNIHAHGRRYRAKDLCKMLTGQPLSADPLMRHLEGKLRPIYGV